MITRLLLLLLAMQALPFSLHAQVVYHDVEAYEAQGPVKSIKTNWSGNVNYVNFSKEGKMSFLELEDAEYDADGYIQKAILHIGDITVNQAYIWKAGMLKTIIATLTVSTPSGKIPVITTTKREYDKRNMLISESAESVVNKVVAETKYSDYLFDSKGNWIRREVTANGETSVATREITYYE